MEEKGGNAGAGGAFDILDTISSEPEVRAPPSSSSSTTAVTASTGNQNEPQVLPAASGTETPGSSSPVSQNNVVSWHRINTVGAPPPRQGHSALIIHDRFMLTFSGGDGGTVFEDLHTYNHITKELSRKSATGRIPEGLIDYGMDIYGDQIFIYGGVKEGCMLSSDCELYELYLIGWEWSKLEPTLPQTGSPPCARATHSFTAVNGKFYCF